MKYILLASLYIFFGLLVVIYHYVTPNEAEFIDKVTRFARANSVVTMTATLHKNQ